ncbi:MAG: Y4bD/Y4pK family protein [Planctomycetes bacterium]|nr:Y4bD/Y4pK family protein [Planctomycetota bacterium]
MRALEVHAVKVIHPFHPFHGRKLELIAHQNIIGVDWVMIDEGDGRRRWFPASWTDLFSGDAFVVQSAGRSHFRVEDLLRLVTLLEDMET